jgi:hypothetical protein
MKLCLPRSLNRRSGERGSTVLIVLTLLLAIVILLVGNGATVHFLQQELRRIDQDQVRRLAQQVAAPSPVADGRPEAGSRSQTKQ